MNSLFFTELCLHQNTPFFFCTQTPSSVYSLPPSDQLPNDILTSLPVLKTSRTAGAAAAAQFSPFPHHHTIILPILSSFPPRSGHWTVTNLLIISRALGKAPTQQFNSNTAPSSLLLDILEPSSRLWGHEASR